MEYLEETPEFWFTERASADEVVDATIVVPVYNAEETLARALRSVLHQSMRTLEVIVVDDASTDGSWSLIRRFASEDFRVRIIRNKRNRGKSVAMNWAVRMARGRWLALLDADDWYDPMRLSVLIGEGERCNATMVADNQFLFDAGAGRVVGTAWKLGTSSWPLTLDGFLGASNPYASFNLGMLKPVMKTDFMRSAGVGYEEGARDGHDFLHLLQFYLNGGSAIINNFPYYYYTQPYGAASHKWSHSRRKRYDFGTMQRYTRRYLDKAAYSLTPRQSASLDRHSRQFGALEAYFQLREHASEGHFLSAFRCFCDRPAMAGYVASRVCRKLAKRADAWAIEHINRATAG
jgi:succinoglycan biosynthesis protein ExoO